MQIVDNNDEILRKIYTQKHNIVVKITQENIYYYVNVFISDGFVYR